MLCCLSKRFSGPNGCQSWIDADDSEDGEHRSVVLASGNRHPGRPGTGATRYVAARIGVFCCGGNFVVRYVLLLHR